MKQFDQIFKQQAEKAFSTFNADNMAEEGWNSFLSRKKGKKRFAIIIPFWAKAASVAVIVSVGGFYIYQTLHNQPDTFIAQKKFMSPQAIQPQAPVISSNSNLKTQPETIVQTSTDLPVILSSKQDPIAEALVKNDSVYDTGKKPSDQLIENQTDESDIDAKLSDNNLAEDIKKEITANDFEEEAPSGSKTSIIAGLSGMMSSIENMMGNSPGVSVGFYIEHKLTRRLSVRPGLALAKHSYGTTNVSSGKVFMNSVTSAGMMTGSVDSYENSLDMVTMEVPVNLVYTIMERSKSSLFISAGVSTMVYLDQNFSSSFTNVYTEQKVDLASGNVYHETRSQDVNVKSDEQAFSHVDYFGLTNLSAGYSLPLKKGGNMLVEPFVQLPVSDLTSFNVRIRYGGLSVKFRFGREDKQAR